LILVVEDSDKNWKLVRDVSTFKGYEIMEPKRARARAGHGLGTPNRFSPR